MTEAARIPGPARRPLMALAGALLLLAGVAGATAEPPTSEANRLLFQTDQLSGVEPPADLHYRFVSRPREGEGDGFEDAIVLHVTPGETAGARRVEVDYFSGERVITSYSIHYTKLYDLHIGRNDPTNLRRR